MEAPNDAAQSPEVVMVTDTENLEKATESDLARQSSLDPGGIRIDVLGMLIVLAAQKLRIARITGAIVLLVTIGSFLLRTKYTSESKILPPQQNASIAAAALGTQLTTLGPLAAAAGKDLGLKNPNDLYVGMLKSHAITDELVRNFDLMKVYGESRFSDAREQLESSTTIVADKEGFVRISVEDSDRGRAAGLANGYVNELQKLTKRVAVTEAGQRRLFFERQVKEASESLSRAEQALKETQQRTGVIQLEGQAQAIVEAVVHLRAQIATKEVQIQAMRAFASERNPDLALLNQELVGLQSQLVKLERQQNSGGGDLQIPPGKVPEFGLEYVRRVRDLKYAESVFELLSKQYEIARVDEARQGAVVQVIDPAVEPDKKSFPKRSLIVLAAAFLGLVIGCCWVLIAESFRRLREHEPEQARRLALLKRLLLSYPSRHP